MTNIELAKQAGFAWHDQLLPLINRFADLIRADERDRLLAGAGEPVGSVINTGTELRIKWFATYKQLEHGTKLYTADQLAAERVKTEQAQADIDNIKQVEFPRRIENVTKALKQRIAALETQLDAAIRARSQS